MIDAPSSTWFTTHPEWHWLVVTYFTLTALAGGCYFLATLLDLMGRPEDRPIARRAYLAVLPMLAAIGVILVVDLSRSERFWHLFIENHTWQPIIKPWSPISVASWMLPIFGFFALLSFLGALSDAGKLRWKTAQRFRPPGALGTAVALLGSFTALYFAAYPGVLLAVTNRPIWADTPLMGMLFVVSAIAMSAALMVLLGGGWSRREPGVLALHRTSVWALMLQFLVLIAVLVTLGAAARAWLNAWGLVIVIGVVLLGMLAPIAIDRRRAWFGERSVGTAALLVLFGGFLLRTVVVFSPEGIHP